MGAHLRCKQKPRRPDFGIESLSLSHASVLSLSEPQLLSPYNVGTQLL